MINHVNIFGDISHVIISRDLTRDKSRDKSRDMSRDKSCDIFQ